MYNLIIPGAVKKDLKKLPEELQKIIAKEHLPSIQSNPHQGKFLKGEFGKFWKYVLFHKNTEYRIVYKITETNKLVIMIMIGSRENFYERLKRRI